MDIRFSDRAGRFQASAIRNKLFDDPALISFAAGKPEPSAFPLEALVAAMEQVLSGGGQSALQYSASEGILTLREQIASERMKAAGVETSPDEIFLTSGSQEGIELSARLFLNEGDHVVCESPSYTGAFNALAPYAPCYVSIPMDENGMRMDALEAALREDPKIKLIYTIPDFQNPTGVTMSDERRQRLTELAAAYRVPVIEDCPYGDLIFEGERHPAVKSFDREGWVLMLGSFSKILAPGLRLGWVCATRQILDKLMMAKQGLNLQSGTLDQHLVARYLQENDIRTHIAELRGIYRERRDRVAACIAEFFPAGIKYRAPQGGFFFWLELDERLDADMLLAEAARDYKAAYVPGRSFFADHSHANFIRLSYSCVSLEEIETGMRRLGACLATAYRRLT